MTEPGDPFDLARFVAAQAGVFDQALAELRAGRKRGHWMWFVFPQLAALGRSATAKHYGIRTLSEAEAYAAHPLLGPRLEQCCSWLLALPADAGAREVLGPPDDLKLRSSMTLFERAWPGRQALFAEVLTRFYDGQRCRETLRLL